MSSSEGSGVGRSAVEPEAGDVPAASFGVSPWRPWVAWSWGGVVDGSRSVKCGGVLKTVLLTAAVCDR